MNITFNYFAQIRQKAGTESETTEVVEGATALESLQSLDHGAEFRGLLFDESGALRPVSPTRMRHIMYSSRDIQKSTSKCLARNPAQPTWSGCMCVAMTRDAGSLCMASVKTVFQRSTVLVVPTPVSTIAHC